MPGSDGAAQTKTKPRYFWLFIILKCIGYPALFFLMFLGSAADIYFFQKAQNVIAISILAGLLLIILMLILQRYIKLFHYVVRGLLALSLLTGLALLVMGGYNNLIWKYSSLKVAVFKGPVSGAMVNIYALNDNGEKGKLIKGPLASDASGNVNFDLPPNLPKRFFIEAKGGSYYSEATGQQVQLKDSDVLTAVLPAGTKTAAVTPFTHMAAALAKAQIQGGTPPADAVISANETIAQQYGVSSILSIPVDATLQASDSADSGAKQYGLLLAGFAQLAKNLGVRSVDLANALASDWSDGTLDGMQNGQKVIINEGPALGTAGTTGLDKAKDQFAKSGKAFSTKETTVTVNPPVTKPTSGLTITTKSLPAWVSGQEGRYTVTAAGGSLPLTWSVKSGSLPGGFALSQDGIISGTYTLPGGVTKKIFPPFTLEVRDQQDQTQTVELAITVVPEVPTIITYNPPTLMVGKSYDELIAKASGGLLPYNRFLTSNGALPAGMQIEATSDGLGVHLTGSPKAKGSFSFRVCVIDSASTEKCGSVAFAVKEAEVAAPTPAPTPEPKEKYDYYPITEDVLIEDITTYSWQSHSCPSYSWLSAFSLTGNILSVDNFSYEGTLNSSGFVSIKFSEDETLTLQLYGSGKGSYLKGTDTHGWGASESCTYSITAERSDKYSNY